MESCDCGGQIEFLEFLSPSLSRYISDPLRSFFRDIFILSDHRQSAPWSEISTREWKKHQSTHHLNVNFRRDHKSNSSHRRTNFNSRSEQLLCIKIVSHQDRMEILGQALTVEINWIPCLCVSWSSFFSIYLTLMLANKVCCVCRRECNCLLRDKIGRMEWKMQK